MLFCGQCGQRLNPGETRCSHCGALVEPGAVIADDIAPDAPTVASPSLLGNMQKPVPGNPEISGDPQKLILRPEQDTGTSNYRTENADEATRRVETLLQNLDTHRTGVPPDPSLAGVPPHYTPPMHTYPSQNMYAEYPPDRGSYLPYSGPPQQGMGNQQYPGQEMRTAPNTRGRTIALLMILFGLLFILIAMTLFILEHNNAFGSNGIHTGSAFILTCINIVSFQKIMR